MNGNYYCCWLEVGSEKLHLHFLKQPSAGVVPSFKVGIPRDG